MKIFSYVFTFVIGFTIAMLIIVKLTDKTKQKEYVYTKGKTDTTYIKGKETIKIKWLTETIHDTMFLSDTTHTANFTLKADSASCIGTVKYIPETYQFSFSNTRINYPEREIRIVDTLILSRIDTLKITLLPIIKWYDRIGVYGGVGISHELKPTLNLSIGYKIF
jgi:hypothetical protein